MTNLEYLPQQDTLTSLPYIPRDVQQGLLPRPEEVVEALGEAVKKGFRMKFLFWPLTPSSLCQVQCPIPLFLCVFVCISPFSSWQNHYLVSKG